MPPLTPNHPLLTPQMNHSCTLAHDHTFTVTHIVLTSYPSTHYPTHTQPAPSFTPHSYRHPLPFHTTPLSHYTILTPSFASQPFTQLLHSISFQATAPFSSHPFHIMTHFMPHPILCHTPFYGTSNFMPRPTSSHIFSHHIAFHTTCHLSPHSISHHTPSHTTSSFTDHRLIHSITNAPPTYSTINTPPTNMDKDTLALFHHRPFNLTSPQELAHCSQSLHHSWLLGSGGSPVLYQAKPASLCMRFFVPGYGPWSSAGSAGLPLT